MTKKISIISFLIGLALILAMIVCLIVSASINDIIMRDLALCTLWSLCLVMMPLVLIYRCVSCKIRQKQLDYQKDSKSSSRLRLIIIYCLFVLTTLISTISIIIALVMVGLALFINFIGLWVVLLLNSVFCVITIILCVLEYARIKVRI